MSKKNMTEEEKKALEAKKAEKKARREARWEKFKDGFAEVGGAMLPITLPVLAMIGVSVAASSSVKKDERSKTRERNEIDDLLAQGKGFEGRRDPKYIAWKYDEESRKEEKKYLRDTDSDDEE